MRGMILLFLFLLAPPAAADKYPECPDAMDFTEKRWWSEYTGELLRCEAENVAVGFQALTFTVPESESQMLEGYLISFVASDSEQPSDRVIPIHDRWWHRGQFSVRLPACPPPLALITWTKRSNRAEETGIKIWSVQCTNQ